MKKNKKVLLMFIMTFISIIVFTSRVDALVMWMQCTNNPDDAFSDSSDFKYYSSFAVVNNKSNTGVRHLVYDSTGFYNSKKPTFVIYNKKDGLDNGDICWYNNWYEDDSGPISDCDRNYDFVAVSELFDGVCPEQVIDNTDGPFTDSGGSVQGDMLVLQGKKKAPKFEVLPDSTFVIYRFKDKNDETGIMIEGYDSSGKYGYATTWEDWSSFEKNLKLKKNGNDWNDLVSKSNYDDTYIDWTGMTQARRIEKFGRDYFKLWDDKRPWLVGAVDDQNFSVDETLIYRSDDSNNSFFNWVSKWYEKYDDKLSLQLDAMKELESSKYEKLYKEAEKIDKAIKEKKKYTFSNEYSVSQMITDLDNAYKLLNLIISSESGLYNYYDSSCQLVDNDTTTDALGAIHTEFICNVFGVSSVERLEHKANAKMLDELVSSALSSAIDGFSESDVSLMSLQSNAQKYVILYETAIKYIRTYEVVTGDDEQILLTLLDNYSEMTSIFGGEVIVGCEDLIDKNLREKIGSYLNIVKIAVPIILILFGIIEFTKAIFAGDEEQMKKAQKNFMIRLVIAIIFFLVPTIVDLLLGIANKVWNTIEPGSCGIFE